MSIKETIFQQKHLEFKTTLVIVHQNANILTIVLFVKALEDQPQFLLMVPQVVHKLLKVQLTIQVFVSSLDDFLKHIHTGINILTSGQNQAR